MLCCNQCVHSVARDDLQVSFSLGGLAGQRVRSNISFLISWTKQLRVQSDLIWIQLCTGNSSTYPRFTDSARLIVLESWSVPKPAEVRSRSIKQVHTLFHSYPQMCEFSEASILHRNVRHAADDTRNSEMRISRLSINKMLFSRCFNFGESSFWYTVDRWPVRA